MQTRAATKLSTLSGASFLTGALIVFVPHWIAGSDSAESPPISSAPASSTSSAPVPRDERTLSVYQERTSYLDAVSRVASWEALAAEVEALALGPPGASRQFALETLLARLFELHPTRALDFVLDLDIPADLLSRVFRTWAEIDVDQALTLLYRIDDPWRERQLALAILQVSGDSPENIEALVSAGASLDPVSLQLAWLTWLAESGNVAEAVENALSLNAYDARRLALQDVARASKDSAAVLSLAGSVADAELRWIFVSEIYKQWSRNDVSAFLDHLATIDPRDPFLASTARDALLFAAEFAPERTFQLSFDLGEPLRRRARSTALQAMASQDPHAALARLESVADTGDTGLLEDLEAIATGFARADLEGALSWLATLDPSHTDIVAQPVLTALAGVDLERAIDLRLDGLGGRGIAFWLQRPFRSDLENPALLADKVFVAGDSQLLADLLGRWTDSEPYDAIAWMQGRQQLPAQVIDSAAQNLASKNVSETLSYAHMLSFQHRSDWVRAAANAGAIFSAEETISALRLFEGEPFYDRAMSIALSIAALREGGGRAAELAGNAPSQMAAALIALPWASDSPDEAAAWALSLSDATVRASAVESVARAWAARDSDRAAIWIDGLTDTNLREQLRARGLP